MSRSTANAKVLKWTLGSTLAFASAAGVLSLTQSFAQAQVQAQGEAAPTLNDIAKAFREVGKSVEPSVVNIKVRKAIAAPRGRGGGMPPGPMQDPFFRRFFDPDNNGEPNFPGDGGGSPFGGGEMIGQGSGVIMQVDGKTAYVVTNYHVAGDADEMQIVLNDGRTIDNAKLVGADPRTEVAVVKIEADGLKAAKWGNSDELAKGDWVLAFGAPFGYVGSMTHGIVSALNRTDLQIIPQGYEQFIQIDAPINPGNSGGPLTNIRGEVIGINTAIASRSGGFQGIGFAIPSNLARQIATQLRDKGKITRGWLGVGITSVGESPNEQATARSFGYEGKNGVLVEQVFPDTPAAGKLQPGDIVTRINGKDVADSSALRNTIAQLAPGSEATLDVYRDGKTVPVKITLGDQPSNLASAGGQEDEQGQPDRSPQEGPRLGVSLSDLSPDLAQRLGLKSDVRGAAVTQVAPRSPAAQAGIRPGDIITKVNTTSVSNAGEAIAAIRKADLKKGVRLYVMSQGGARFVFVQVPDKEPAKK
jgi:serine protease Do